MSAKWSGYSSNKHERDLLNILMDSNLYFDLSLRERRTLLKHIVESYKSPSLTPQTDSMGTEKQTNLSDQAITLDV